MADPNAFLHGPRRRNLAILTAAAALSVALAVLSLSHQASLVAPKYAPTEFFPGLSAKMRDVALIRVESKKAGRFEIAFKPSAGWVLPSMHDYPADFDQGRTTLVGMAGLQTVAPRTARAGWLHYLGLDTPAKGGTGTEISLLDEKGHVIAAMIAGNTKDIGDPSAEGLFVRRPDSNQSWLARSVFEPKPDPNDWLKKDVISIDRARIQEADVQPVDGPSYVVRREKPSDPDFQLLNMPKGRALGYVTAPDGVAAAIVGFTFDKVAPATQFDFSDAGRLITRTFDGLEVTTSVLQQGGASWAMISADAVPGKADAQQEAHAINKAAGGWAFEIPAYKSAQFLTSRDSLLKPVEGEGKKPVRKK